MNKEIINFSAQDLKTMESSLKSTVTILKTVEEEYNDLGNKVKTISTELKTFDSIVNQTNKSLNSFDLAKSIEVEPVTKDLKELNTTIKQTGDTAADLNLSKTVDAAPISTSFRSAFSVVGSVFSVITSVTGVIKDLAGELYELSLAGADFNTVRDGFYNLSGSVEKANKDLVLFRKSSSFNLNDKELMSYANSMYTLGINSEQTAQLLDLIEDSGDRVGKVFGDAKETISTFLTSGNTSGLTDLQLDANLVSDEIEKLTTSLGKNKIALTDVERQQINTTALLNVYGKSIDEVNNKQLDGSDKIFLMKSSLENLKTGFESFIAEAMAPVIETAQLFIGEYEKMIVEIFGGKEAVDQLKKGFIEFVEKALKYVFNEWKQHLLPALKELYESVKKLIDENPELVDSFFKFGKIMFDVGLQIDKYIIKSLTWLIDNAPTIKRILEGFMTMGVSEVIRVFGGSGSGMSSKNNKPGQLFQTILDLTNEKERIARKEFSLKNEGKESEFKFDFKGIFLKELDITKRLTLGKKELWDIEEEINTVIGLRNLLIGKQLFTREVEAELLEKKNDLIEEQAQLIKKEAMLLEEMRSKADPEKPELKEETEARGGRPKFKNRFIKFEERLGYLTSIGDQVQTVMELFTDNTKTAVHEIVKGFQSVLTIVQGIRAVFENIKLFLETFQTVKDIGSFLLDILPLPFAEGGRVPGYGSGDTVPAMLTPGEFVIRKSVVDKMGSSFFAWINGGLLPSKTGYYAMGGMVSPAPSPVVNNSFDVHIDRRGDVHVVQKALQKIKSNKTYFGS